MLNITAWMTELGETPLGHWVLNTAMGQIVAGVVLLVLISLVTGFVVSKLLALLARRMLTAVGKGHWAEALKRRRVARRLSYAVPLMLVMSQIYLLPMDASLGSLLARLFLIAGMVFLFVAINAILSAWQDIYAQSARAQTYSIKGYLELAKIVVWCVGLVLILSIIINRSPLLMLSGIGALSAVLLLVFKDTLLSMVASTQMTANDMLRIGDWIEMPQAGADGFVIDMALHTVKVQNWDKTVTTIPTYKLFSESYKNWRHMFESGGRRIKRTLRIDASSIRFLDDEEISSLSRYSLLHEYLLEKQREVEQTNRALGEAARVDANRRRLTNIGTFRAYALAYLRQNRELHQDMLMIVRMMEPDAQGVPVEVYCFANKTAWVEYERIQGDIFDHLLAVLPELRLRLYQAPSGSDIARGLGGGSRREAMERAYAVQPSPQEAGPASQ
ncbi:miniconductance mechanosensitive channel [Paracandidimonas soli]|uniref:Mechanosensing system component YbdG n=2 Tax=Paracandidimonas soli TaxID=1917182 RepID=A0A4R3VBV5_9BURK|nr:miniconductance mechanosensitive channel [Paracandidimonas soli]